MHTQEKVVIALSLARFVYLHKNRVADKPKLPTELNRELVRGDHGRQAWMERVHSIPTAVETSNQTDGDEQLEHAVAEVG